MKEGFSTPDATNGDKGDGEAWSTVERVDSWKIDRDANFAKNTFFKKWVEEEGKFKEESKNHLFLTRDSQMQYEKHSSIHNRQNNLSHTNSAPFCTKLKRVKKKKIKAFYVR